MEPIAIISLISVVIIASWIYHIALTSNYKSRVSDTLEKFDCRLIDISKAPHDDRGGLTIPTKVTFGGKADSKPKPTIIFKVKFSHNKEEYDAHVKVTPTKELTGEQLSVIFQPRLDDIIG